MSSKNSKKHVSKALDLRQDRHQSLRKKRPYLSKHRYMTALKALQIELVKMQGWVKEKGLKVVVLFEGRDAAGKGGVIKRITERLNPRIVHVVALAVPTEREKSQWYFQRYVPHLPAAGEIVLFDRSWYNRAGVERVMGFATEEQVQEFFRSVPEFENMLIRSGIILIKYWFSVSDDEQERRFQARIDDITKRWKLSPMDMASRTKWVDYSRAKDDMFRHTDTSRSPWYVVDADNKRWARLNCISHLLTMIPYRDITPAKIQLPERQIDETYVRPPIEIVKYVPDYDFRHSDHAAGAESQIQKVSSAEPWDDLDTDGLVFEEDGDGPTNISVRRHELNDEDTNAASSPWITDLDDEDDDDLSDFTGDSFPDLPRPVFRSAKVLDSGDHPTRISSVDEDDPVVIPDGKGKLADLIDEDENDQEGVSGEGNGETV